MTKDTRSKLGSRKQRSDFVPTILPLCSSDHLAAMDYDAAGFLAGIEILDAVKRLGDPAVFKQVILENVSLAKPTRKI